MIYFKYLIQGGNNGKKDVFKVGIVLAYFEKIIDYEFIKGLASSQRKNVQQVFINQKLVVNQKMNQVML